MSNDVWVNQWKLGKLNIDINSLSNGDKIRYARIENLLKDLIHYYESTKKLMVRFDEGHFKDEESMQKMQEIERA